MISAQNVPSPGEVFLVKEFHRLMKASRRDSSSDEVRRVTLERFALDSKV